jgi:Tol biopolymer transport system component
MLASKPTEDRIAARKVRVAAFVSLVLLCVGVCSLGSASAFACPNEQFRAGLSAGLSDCRAYEMVSPLDKNGFYVSANGTQEQAIGQASGEGDAVVYVTNGAFPGSAAGTINGFYLASRGEGGWSTQSLLPPQAYSYPANFAGPVFAAYSPDLSKGVLLDSTDSPLLVSGEQEGGLVGNLFLRDNATGAYSLLNVPASGLDPSPYEPTFDGASEDFTSVIFDAPAALTPEAPGGGADNLYEWDGGSVALVSQIPPAGSPSCGPGGPACVAAAHGGRFGGENAHHTTLESPNGSLVRAISADGSRIFFTVEGNLYARENATTTVRLDAPQGGAGPGGGGVWATAAGDGSQAFFFDEASAGLTADTQSGSGTNLYSYDTLTGTLTDLTPVAKAEVLGVVDEASGDGSYLYFVARGVLSTEKNSLGEEALPGAEAENVYVAHDGTISFIHTIMDHSKNFGKTGEVDSHTLGLFEHRGSRVTPDGRHVAFFAEDRGRNPGGLPLFAELFEYSAVSGQVVRLCGCEGGEFRQQSSDSPTLNQDISTFQYSRGLSDDGDRVVIESYDPLLSRDTDGQPDVYEYELDGTGSCTVAPGCLSLISTGTSEHGSWFVDASASGEDVFFTTSQQLVSSDTDGAYDLYDARVDGGVPLPTQPPECLGDGCLNVPPAPIDATPSSLTFSGAGNVPVPPATLPPAAVKSRSTGAQKLAGALKACGKKRGAQRKRCEAQARKRYARTAGRRPRARHARVDRRAGK